MVQLLFEIADDLFVVVSLFIKLDYIKGNYYKTIAYIMFCYTILCCTLLHSFQNIRLSVFDEILSKVFKKNAEITEKIIYFSEQI